MATRDVARENWRAFFDEFSRRHEGDFVTVTVADPADARVEARALPLVGVSVDDRGSEAGAIAIMLGTEPDDHVTHTIAQPTHVYHKTGAGIMSDEIDHAEALEITAAGEPPVTYVRIVRQGGAPRA